MLDCGKLELYPIKIIMLSIQVIIHRMEQEKRNYFFFICFDWIFIRRKIVPTPLYKSSQIHTDLL